jgi:23S rRNA (cytosine1962-C5)-methyltransferase
MTATSVHDRIAAAIDRRADLLARLQREGTDCYRLFHGVAEGEPGLTVDRYGPVLLLQTFRAPMPAAEVAAIGELVQRRLGAELPFCCNHRGEPPAADFVMHEPAAAALAEVSVAENGVQLLQRARHRGQDPWLFLDLRAGRRALAALARGRSVLNLFAYTCGAGIAAAVAGATEVGNVDFAASALAIGLRNAERNGVADRCTFVTADCIPVLRQLAGLPIQRIGKSHAYPRLERRPYDVVVLDPPRWSKGPFGAVDVVRDYQSLFKPCLLTLAAGGVVLATNHAAEVDADAFVASLRRCADKAGRPLADVQLLAPDSDFPAFDGRPPLKIALCRVG